jgi:hypothetical protein
MAKPSPGHPRDPAPAENAWIIGTSPVMTLEAVRKPSSTPGFSELDSRGTSPGMDERLMSPWAYHLFEPSG